MKLMEFNPIPIYIETQWLIINWGITTDLRATKNLNFVNFPEYLKLRFLLTAAMINFFHLSRNK